MLKQIQVNEQILFVPLASALHEPKFVNDVVSVYRRWLKGCFDYEIQPVSKVSIEESQRFGATAGVLALVVTGGCERLIQDMVRSGRPTIILAHGSMNSLPAAIEGLSSIEEERRPQLVVSRTKGELEKVREFSRAARVFARLGKYRIGLVGGPSSWLTYSVPNRNELFRHLGIELVDIEMEEFNQAYEGASQSLVSKLAAQAQSKPKESAKLTAEDFRKSARIYAANRTLAEKHNLTAVSLRCFDFLTDYKASGCYAVAKLNDENFVAGCEGDIPATTAMIVLSEVSNFPAFMANASSVKGNKVVLAHCTIAPRLTTKYRYRTHFESGLGVAIAGTLRKGRRATVARFSSAFDVLRAGEGVVVRGEAWSEELCRTQVEIKMDRDAELIKNRPLGNHYAVTYGEHINTLRNLASFAGMKFEEI